MVATKPAIAADHEPRGHAELFVFSAHDGGLSRQTGQVQWARRRQCVVMPELDPASTFFSPPHRQKGDPGSSPG